MKTTVKNPNTRKRRADDAPLTKAELARMKPLHAFPALEKAIKTSLAAGRPAGTATKDATSIRFDKDVMRELRRRSGWQTWVNDLVRVAVGLDHKS